MLKETDTRAWGMGDCSDNLGRPLAVSTSETLPLGDDLCGSGAGRPPPVHIPNIHDCVAKRKAPCLSILTTHNFAPRVAMSKADGRGQDDISRLLGGRAQAGSSPPGEASSARRLGLWGHDHMRLHGHAQFCPLAGHLSED